MHSNRHRRGLDLLSMKRLGMKLRGERVRRRHRELFRFEMPPSRRAPIRHVVEYEWILQ
jgi:hypothetical protein